MITIPCASCVRQDDRWLVDNPDSVDPTEIQAAFHGVDRALQWLNGHNEIVVRVDITYAEDEW